MQPNCVLLCCVPCKLCIFVWLQKGPGGHQCEHLLFSSQITATHLKIGYPKISSHNLQMGRSDDMVQYQEISHGTGVRRVKRVINIWVVPFKSDPLAAFTFWARGSDLNRTNNVWDVKWTFILHLPISVIRVSDLGQSIIDFGKSFSDIGKSSYFTISVNHLPISEIRITDIWNSNFRCR